MDSLLHWHEMFPFLQYITCYIHNLHSHLNNVSLYIIIYTQIIIFSYIVTNTSHLNPIYVLSCGCVSGVCASVITQPFDVVKTRLQIGTSHNQGIMSIMMSIVNKDGMKYLFSGLTPRVIRRTLMAAFTWMFYEEVCSMSLN